MLNDFYFQEEGDQLLQDIENGQVPASQMPTEELKNAAPKFGWIKGVLVSVVIIRNGQKCMQHNFTFNIFK